MPTFDRTTIVRGPCKVTYGGATFYAKGGVKLTQTNANFEKETDAYGIVGRAKTDFTTTIEFTPVGEIESLTVLFAQGNAAIGSSLATASDTPLVIVSADATYTFLAAFITGIPSISASASKTAFGSVTFTSVLKKNGDPAVAADYYTYGAGASIGTAFDPTKIVTGPYSATLGAIGPFFSEGGFEIAFDMTSDDVMVDGIGLVDKTFGGIACTITCIPTGIDQDDFDTYFSSLDAGEELASSTLDISTATSGGLNFDCAAVQLISLERNFAPNANRLGTLTLQAKRTFNAGAQVALYTVTAVA
jgi:hypothetical protein